MVRGPWRGRVFIELHRHRLTARLSSRHETPHHRTSLITQQHTTTFHTTHNTQSTSHILPSVLVHFHRLQSSVFTVHPLSSSSTTATPPPSCYHLPTTIITHLIKNKLERQGTKFENFHWCVCHLEGELDGWIFRLMVFL